MIITKLIGGLGNQMFQYAVARRIAHVNHELLKLDLTGYHGYKLRDYCLNQLNITERIATEAETQHVKNSRYIREEYFHFNPAILKLTGDIYLEGYWQSEKYFKDIADLLKIEFMVKQPLNGINQGIASAIQRCSAVAVHFRRGDYVSHTVTSQVHGVCPIGYYRQAMSYLVNHGLQPHFFIFSDDIAWVKHNIGSDFACTFVAVNDSNHGFEDLRLISYCKHHIIANSTFSWWGAWLASYPHKIVFAPRRWFNQSNHLTYDLLPENWNLI